MQGELETALRLLSPESGKPQNEYPPALEARLWELCALQAKRWSMGESDSLPVETAAALFESLCFTLGLRLKTLGADPRLLLSAELPTLLREGQGELAAECERGKLLLKKVRETAPAFENTAYLDTVAALGGFFRRYDLRFFAHDIPCVIDYPLCRPVSEALVGVVYINVYLERLLMENRFCNRFAPALLAALYKAAVPEPKELLFNLFEPVAVNALGRALLGLSPFPLGISREERERLLALLRCSDEARILAALREAAGRLAGGDSALGEYLWETALALLPRLRPLLAGGRLQAVFLTF